MDSSELKSGLNDLKLRLNDIREGVFDVTSKENRLKKIEDDLAKEEVWSDLELSQKISKEKTALEKSLASFKFVEEKVSDGLIFIDIAVEEGDEASIKEIIESFNEMEN
jgi:peptide chain release factor 2